MNKKGKKLFKILWIIVNKILTNEKLFSRKKIKTFNEINGKLFNKEKKKGLT